MNCPGIEPGPPSVEGVHRTLAGGGSPPLDTLAHVK